MSQLTSLWDEILHTAWWRFVRLWKPMALWTLVVFLFFGAFLGPLLSGGISSAVFRGDLVMVGNEDLLFWLLRPEGLLYAMLAAALFAMGAALRYAGIFVIIRDDISDTSSSVAQTLYSMMPDLPALFRLCLAAVGATLLLLIPLLAGAGVSYLLWIAEHDINYYLYAKPPEWYNALITFGVWTFIWLMAVGYLVLRTIPALPAYLDGHRPVVAAVRRAWRCTRGDAWRVLGLLAFCVVVWIAARALASGTFYFVAALSIDYLSGALASVTPIVLLTGGWLAGSIMLDAAISFVGFSFAATVLTKFYFEDTPLHSTLPGRSIRARSIPGRVLAKSRKWIHPRRLVPVFGVLVVLSVGASVLLLELGEEPPDFMVTAHRAGAHLAPENSLAALERSIEAGADYVEIDVQATSDNVLVVAHDADLMRVAGVPLRITATPFSEMEGLLLGKDDSIPDEERQLATLGEFLERADGRIDLMIEPKFYGADPALVELILQEVRDHNMEDQVMIIALDMAAIRQVQRLAPELETGYLASVTMGDITRLPVDMLGVSLPLASSGLITAAHERDLSVQVWTLNRATTMLQAISRGADGIITDDPVLAVQLRNELAGLTTTERLLLHLRPYSPAFLDLRDNADY